MILYSAKIPNVGRNQLSGKCRQMKITEEWHPECVRANKTDNSKFHMARNVESISFGIELVRIYIVKLRYVAPWYRLNIFHHFNLYY